MLVEFIKLRFQLLMLLNVLFAELVKSDPLRLLRCILRIIGGILGGYVGSIRIIGPWKLFECHPTILPFLVASYATEEMMLRTLLMILRPYGERTTHMVEEGQGVVVAFVPCKGAGQSIIIRL